MTQSHHGRFARVLLAVILCMFTAMLPAAAKAGPPTAAEGPVASASSDPCEDDDDDEGDDDDDGDREGDDDEGGDDDDRALNACHEDDAPAAAPRTPKPTQPAAAAAPKPPVTPVPVVTPPVPVAAPAPTPLAPAAAVPAAPRLLNPFPVTRIRGEITRRGARIREISVQAPAGSRVTVTCRGGGCPRRSVTKRTEVARFRHLRRELRAGAVVGIRVTRGNAVGKFTSFRIRRGRAPVRRDLCLAPGVRKPARCSAF